MKYSIDTCERKKMFEARRGAGWEEEYRRYRSEWEKRPKMMDCGEYPLDVLIEPIWACNLKCPMCSRNVDSHENHRDNSIMDINIYKRLIDEIGGKTPSVRLAGLGEATLHPNFIEMIEYAKRKGVGEVSLVTNGGGNI